MKNIRIILLVLPMLGLISCVKQKNCEEGITGIFECLDEPLIVTNPNCVNTEKKVVALFKPVIGDGGFYDTVGLGVSMITGPVPSKYKVTEPIKVKASMKQSPKRNSPHDNACSPTSKLTCIEKED